MEVIKRDGRRVVFDKKNIQMAMFRAFSATYRKDFEKDKEFIEFTNKVAESIEQKASNRKEPFTVEELQDEVERKLMDSRYKKVARAYISYRNERTKEREKKSALMAELSKKLTAQAVENQNANVDEHSFGGRMGEARSVVTKEYALYHCMSEMARDNHLNNIIYIHDLDSYAVGEHNCLSVPFDKLLRHGFNTRQTDVRPARSVNTAFQLVAVLFQLQSLQQFGGVSATHLDWTMVPYVRISLLKHFITSIAYDNDCSKEEVKLELYPILLEAWGKDSVFDTTLEIMEEKVMGQLVYDNDFDLMGELEKLCA